MESVLADKPSPFFMCIGPHHQVMNIQTRDAYRNFYRHLFETKNFGESYSLLNREAKTHDIFLADNMALRIAAHIKSTMFTPAYKIKAAIELEALIKKGNKTNCAENFNKSLKLYLYAKRQEGIKFIIKIAETFLMIDIYPELRDKFQIESRISEYFKKI